ncbi:NADP-specific glutamate dehydrogenase [Uncinocarpus reesii 1704]|uniref:NADP-specific glutamate dehydrogenase n=1 Tax=Uncinocarpus reesii (strain UAMH 1704) TaxID=336963 RepID=C4JW59_UNCRE|nr:NADP-specific glutamate dehydrogenase [Uncinocarpus reesii 1704]EEP81936.1 NADP-specific glutamate dehydrogenase [Uncinocarpus reesii 1704]
MSHLPIEPEFEQAYKELAFSLDNSTLFEKHPEYRKALLVASIPERTIQFRVTWENDKGELEVNRGYRVQFNSALGPYKGGLRFHPTVNMSILKFLWLSNKSSRTHSLAYAALKVIEFGGTVISLSDSKGSLIVRNEGDSITPKEIYEIQELKDQRKQLSVLADAPNFKDRCVYIEGARPWLHAGKVDVALPCATQNEVSGPEAIGLIDNGCKYIAEGSNMGCTLSAIEHFEAHRQLHKKGGAAWYAPGKAANAGGVAVSGLEMAQNSQRLTWTAEEVDQKLKDIMKTCFETGVKTSENYTSLSEDQLPSLVIGSNIAGFIKVAEAMKDHGDWF